MGNAIKKLAAAAENSGKRRSNRRFYVNLFLLTHHKRFVTREALNLRFLILFTFTEFCESFLRTPCDM